jgi:hypothetical protein
MAPNTPILDLSKLSFDEFVRMFFDHDTDAEEFWYQSPDMLDVETSSPSIVIEHMTRLFKKFANVASDFSPGQINAGIWAMLGPGHFALQKYLWPPRIALSDRVDCIHSMYFVYSDYVAKSAVQLMENCFSMWWDFIASGFWEYLRWTQKIDEGDVASLNHEQRALLDSMFETLSKILALPDARTQGYALHGLGHLHHPRVITVVQKFLDSNRFRMSPEEISWIEKCRDGNVM